MKKSKFLSLLAIASLFTFINTPVNAQVNNTGLEREIFILPGALPNGQNGLTVSFITNRLRIEEADFLGLPDTETFFFNNQQKDFFLPTFRKDFKLPVNRKETIGRVVMGIGVPLIFLGVPGIIFKTSFVRVASGHGPLLTDWVFATTGVALTGASTYLLNNSKASSASMGALSQEDIYFYRRKSTKLRTYAWISLAVGPPMLIGSWALTISRANDHLELRRFGARFFWNTGAALIGASIPLFIAASSYKKRSTPTNFSFDLQRIDLPAASGINSVVQPGIKFSIAL